MDTNVRAILYELRSMGDDLDGVYVADKHLLTSLDELPSFISEPWNTE